MKKLIFLVVIAIIIGIAYQCFYVQEKEIPEIIPTITEYKTLDTLNIGILKFDTLNPINSKNVYVQQVLKLIYNPLFEISYNFKAEPCLIKEYSELNKTTYIITLKENILWHDNKTLNSADIEYTIRTIKNQEESIYYPNVKNIKNVKIIDERTLRLELYNEEPFFEYNLIFPIISERENVGTGKYKVLKNEDELILENTEFNIKYIKIKKYEEMGQMFNSYKNGEIDIINTQNIEYKDILGEIGFNKKEYNGREYTYIDFNLKNIADNKIRQAIYYAINKNEIIYKVYKNNYNMSKLPLDTTHWLYKDKIDYKYDIEKSIQILEEAGWEYANGYWQKNKKRIETKILVDSMDETKNDIAYILKNQLEKVGIDIKIEKVSTKLYNYYQQNKNYDIIINTRYIGLNPNLEEYFEKENINKDIRALVNNIKNTTEDRQLIELYKNIEEKYEQDISFISLCCNRQTLIYSEKLYGSINPNWYNMFYNIETWKKIDENT